MHVIRTACRSTYHPTGLALALGVELCPLCMWSAWGLGCGMCPMPAAAAMHSLEGFLQFISFVLQLQRAVVFWLQLWGNFLGYDVGAVPARAVCGGVM